MRTTWSHLSVHERTGLTHRRTKPAFARLIEDGAVVLERAGARPRYRLPGFSETPWSPQPPSGRVPASTPLDPQWLWLPNGIVCGVAGESGPVELLRQIGDVLLLRLFIELYGEHDLASEGGVSRSVFHQQWKGVGEDARQLGHRVFCFNEPVTIAYPDHPIIQPHWNASEPAGSNFSQRVEQLKELGLFFFVPHLTEGPGPDAEIIHPYGINPEMSGDALPIEYELGEAAHAAAERLLQLRIPPDLLRLAPLPAHFVAPQLVGIARLRYRPHTRATKSWYRDINIDGQAWLHRYKALGTPWPESCDDARVYAG